MKRALGELRIIAGDWRSRRVCFDANPVVGVRATPDRVRQTLFDWLSPYIEGAECLDLFAGSGALGLEALSRGAEHCLFLETSASHAQAIRHALADLKAGSRARVEHADGLQWLAQQGTSYDVVFLDPPFASTLLSHALAALPKHLRAVNRVFVEWGGEPPELPAGFTWLKTKQAGAVSYGLLTYRPEDLLA